MKRIALLTLLLVAGTMLPAHARTPDTVDPAWEKFVAARRVFQLRLCELAVRRWPEYAPFFTAHRDLQLAYIERRNLVFYRFKDTQPNRIIRDKGGEAFINFGWTPEEEKLFVKTIPGYGELLQEIRGLQSKTEKFKKRDALRDRFSRLEIDPEYLALMREMTRSVMEAERTLNQAQPLPTTPTQVPQA